MGESVVECESLSSMPRVSFSIGGRVFDLAPEQVRSLSRLSIFFLSKWMYFWALYLWLIYLWDPNIHCCWVISTSSKSGKEAQLSASVVSQLSISLLLAALSGNSCSWLATLSGFQVSWLVGRKRSWSCSVRVLTASCLFLTGFWAMFSWVATTRCSIMATCVLASQMQLNIKANVLLNFKLSG